MVDAFVIVGAWSYLALWFVLDTLHQNISPFVRSMILGNAKEHIVATTKSGKPRSSHISLTVSRMSRMALSWICVRRDVIPFGLGLRPRKAS
mmetsp:Transcript_10204/g.18567  ORF Transcript_10204/g.18567 Transcript_10204/m.18567 type:complete len:92 (-) Transcript_10204:275-550(-)